MIDLQNVRRVYTTGEIKLVALDKINLHLTKGEFVSLMGPSGSGKSTLLNLIGCLDRPSSGTIRINDVDISKMSDDEKASLRNGKIGFVFQIFNLLPRYTALENVSLPLLYTETPKKEQEERAFESLLSVGLVKRSHHYPNQLSGGEQQRVAIARAVVNNPDVLLADEPTGNLDSSSGEEVMEIFTKLNQKGTTILLVTHDPYIAKKADRILQIRDGKIKNS